MVRACRCAVADVSLRPFHLCRDDASCWHYCEDEVQLDSPDRGTRRIQLPPSGELLENLVLARTEGQPVIWPPQRCRSFTAVLEWLLDNIPPAAIPPQYVTAVTGSTAAVTIPGVSDLVEQAAADQCLLSELGPTWTAQTAPSPSPHGWRARHAGERHRDGCAGHSGSSTALPVRVPAGDVTRALASALPAPGTHARRGANHRRLAGRSPVALRDLNRGPIGVQCVLLGRPHVRS